MKEINIARTLLAKRKEKNITQDELAYHMGVSKASVSKWETGQSYPDITLLPYLATFYNISVDELIGYEPQMTKEDIRQLYHKLRCDFSEKPFSVVLEECQNIIRKYYSCYPLLIQIGLLLLNHHTLEPDSQKRQTLLTDTLDLFMRIKKESDDIRLIKEANYMEAAVFILLGNPQSALELLNDAALPALSEKILLSNVYSMMGQPEKAEEILQIDIYQSLIQFLGAVPGFLQLSIHNPEKFEEIIRRTIAVSDLFNLSILHPHILMGFYISAADGYLRLSQTKNALSMLEKYTDLASSISFPQKLKGDAFFNLIDPWFQEFDLGADMPRNEITVKKEMVAIVEKNPGFTALSENKEFRKILHKLKSILKEDLQKGDHTL